MSRQPGAELTWENTARTQAPMRSVALVVVASLAIGASSLGSTVASASGPPSTPATQLNLSDSDTDDDLGILLADMFASAARVLAAHQDQAANEAYLGSAASSHRLRSAILQAPDVTLRDGARPLIEGWIIGED
jgi:hypothetical protein